MSSTQQKILILGLDGATWTILKPLIDNGKLPNIHALVKSGASGVLISAIPPVTAPAWTNFQTGSNGGKHGIFDFRVFNRFERRVWLASSLDIQLPTIWQIASASDRRVIAINVPLTFPPQPVNGTIIGGILAQNEDESLLYPSRRYDEIFGKHPDYRISSPIVSRRGVMGRSAYVDANIEVEYNRFKLAHDLMINEPWDIFMLQNQSLDYIQHSYFHLMDPGEKGYDQKERDDVTRFYQAMDENIGKLIDSTPPDTNVIVVSDHGFKLQKRLIHLAPWLRDRGYLIENISPGQQLLQILRKYDSLKLRRHLAHWVLRDKKARFGKASIDSLNRIDWRRSRAYTAIGSNFGCIYINQEIVEDKDFLLDMISEELAELQDPRNGRRVVKHIYRSDELFQGPYTRNAPDLIAEPEMHYSFGAPSIVTHENIFTDVDSDLEMPGGHHPEGLFIWHGPDVKYNSGLTANLMDIAPTILARLQIPIPNHMDGHVLDSLFKSPLMANFQEWDFDLNLSSEEFLSKQDEDQLTKRLSDLGYL